MKSGEKEIFADGRVVLKITERKVVEMKNNDLLNNDYEYLNLIGEGELEGHLKNSPKVHLIINKLWNEQISREDTKQVIKDALTNMQDGYHLSFALLVMGEQRLPCVLLLAEDDFRTQAFGYDLVPGATHLAILLIFRDRTSWQEQVDKLIRFWPEQPGKPQRIYCV